MSDSTYGSNAGVGGEQTSHGADVNAGFDDDVPAAPATSEVDTGTEDTRADSHEADIDAAYDDDGPEVSVGNDDVTEQA